MNSKKLHAPIFSLRALSITALIATAASYALLSVGSRLLAEGFGPMTQVYVRIGFASLLSIVIFWKNIRWQRFARIPKTDWWILVLMGTFGYAVSVYFLTLGALHAKLLNVSIIFATVPFFTYIYSYIFLKKPIYGKLIASLLLSSIGVWMVATKSFIPVLSGFGIGELFVVLGAATGSLFYVGRKMLSSYLNNSEITVLVLPIAFLCAWIFAIAQHEPLHLENFANTHVIAGLIIGIGLNIITTFFESFSFEHLDAVLGSQILLLDNVFSFVLGYFLYKEFISLPEVVGGMIVIGSVYWANKYLT